MKEAIVNGIAHRDYMSTGSVQVELFPDKLLVMSPGRPHPAVDIAHLDKSHPSNPVNPLIADALYQTGHIERLGTGLEDLFKTCRREGLPKPEAYIGDDNTQWQFRWDNDHFEEEYGITLFCRNNKYYVWGADIDAAETEVLSEWSLNELSCDNFLDSLIFPELPCGEIIQLRNRLANHLRSDCQLVRNILADPQHDKTGIIRDADTILADIMEESYEEGFEITGIGMDILKTWLNSSDKKAVEALFYDLTNVEFHDYIRKCQEIMEV